MDGVVGSGVIGAIAPRPAKRRWRSWWLRQLRTWHWVSAAIALVALLFFAVTGVTLNHADSIPATPHVTDRQGTVPMSLLKKDGVTGVPLAQPLARAVQDAVGIDPSGGAAEWSADEVYVPLPRPGGDAWVSIDRASGAVEAEVTTRGWIAFANDLHKGRNAGKLWIWFIDLVAVGCGVFALSGLLLLQVHAKTRPSTWPLVLGGIALPVVLVVLFLH